MAEPVLGPRTIGIMEEAAAATRAQLDALSKTSKVIDPAKVLIDGVAKAGADAAARTSAEARNASMGQTIENIVRTASVKPAPDGMTGVAKTLNEALSKAADSAARKDRIDAFKNTFDATRVVATVVDDAAVVAQQVAAVEKPAQAAASSAKGGASALAGIRQSAANGLQSVAGSLRSVAATVSGAVGPYSRPIAAAAVVVAGVGGFLALRDSNSEDQPAPAPQPAEPTQPGQIPTEASEAASQAARAAAASSASRAASSAAPAAAQAAASASASTPAASAAATTPVPAASAPVVSSANSTPSTARATAPAGAPTAASASSDYTKALEAFRQAKYEEVRSGTTPSSAVLDKVQETKKAFDAARKLAVPSEADDAVRARSVEKFGQEFKREAEEHLKAGRLQPIASAPAAAAPAAKPTAKAAAPKSSSVAVDGVITVQNGDWLTTIALTDAMKDVRAKVEAALGTKDRRTVLLTMAEIMAVANDIDSPDKIKKGMKIDIKKTEEKIAEVVAAIKKHPAMIDTTTPNQITLGEYNHGLAGQTTKDILAGKRK